MSSIVHKVKDAIRGDESDNRYGSNPYRNHDSNSHGTSHGIGHRADDDDDYGTTTTTTTGTSTNVIRSRTPAANEEYEPISTTTPTSRHTGTAHSTLSPTNRQGLAATSARSEPPPLPGREPPTVPGRRHDGNYVPSTDTHTGTTGAHIGTSGDRIGEAVTGKPSVPHTASKDAASNIMDTSSKIVSPTTTREDRFDNDNNKHGSIHDLRKSHEKRDELGDTDRYTERNNTSNIFGTGKTHDDRNDYDGRRNTVGDQTHTSHHGSGLTAQQRDNRDANIAGATGAAGLAASSSINRRAVGTGNNNRDSFVNSNDTYRNNPLGGTHMGSTTTEPTQGGIHNGVIGHGSGRDFDQTGHNGLGRSTGSNHYDSGIPSIIPAVGPAPKAAATNDRRFDDDNDRFGNNSRFGVGDSRYNNNNNSNVDGVSLRDNSNNRRHDGYGRNTDEFGRVVNDDNRNRNSNNFDRSTDGFGRSQNNFGRDDDNYNNRNSGIFDNRNSRYNDNYNRNDNDNYNRNNNYGRNNDTYGRNNDNYGNNRYGNTGANQPWSNGPTRSGTGQLVKGVFGNPATGLDHHGPGYNGSKVMHECEHCGNDNDITHYFRKEAVYRLHRV